jgi:periplasmic chaperone LolA
MPSLILSLSLAVSMGLAAANGSPKVPGPKAPAPKAKAATKTSPKKDDAALAALTQKIQRTYEQTRDFEAAFRQVYTRVALSRTFEQAGTLTIKKPGMMRWAYRVPEEKLFLADGETLTIYEPEEAQVTIVGDFDSQKLSESVSFLWGEKKLTTAFDIDWAKDKGRDWLSLTPKKDATYRRLDVRVDPKTGLITESVLFETTGNTNHFFFESMKRNTGVKKSRFAFDIPDGVEVIRQ